VSDAEREHFVTESSLACMYLVKYASKCNDRYIAHEDRGRGCGGRGGRGGCCLCRKRFPHSAVHSKAAPATLELSDDASDDSGESSWFG